MASFEPQDTFDLTEPPPRPTTPPVRRGFLLVLAVLFLAAILVYGFPYVAERTGYAWEAGRARAATETLRKFQKEGLDKGGVFERSALYRLATVAISPAVVRIESGHQRRDGDAPGAQLGLGNLLNLGFENSTLGSGFVIDKDRGFILTNAHVVSDELIKVRLSQGREVPARLIGADEKTDLAVIQINASLKVAAEWGDSDKLAAGDAVLAGAPHAGGSAGSMIAQRRSAPMDHRAFVEITGGLGRSVGRSDATTARCRPPPRRSPGARGSPRRRSRCGCVPPWRRPSRAT